MSTGCGDHLASQFASCAHHYQHALGCTLSMVEPATGERIYVAGSYHTFVGNIHKEGYERHDGIGLAVFEGLFIKWDSNLYWKLKGNLNKLFEMMFEFEMNNEMHYIRCVQIVLNPDICEHGLHIQAAQFIAMNNLQIIEWVANNNECPTA